MRLEREGGNGGVVCLGSLLMSQSNTGRGRSYEKEEGEEEEERGL